MVSLSKQILVLVVPAVVVASLALCLSNFDSSKLVSAYGLRIRKKADFNNAKGPKYEQEVCDAILLYAVQVSLLED